MTAPQNKGRNAERLLEDPAFRDALEGIERQIVETLKGVQLDGKPDTERYVLELVRCLQAQARQSRFLWQQVEHGKLAQHELDRRKPLGRGRL